MDEPVKNVSARLGWSARIALRKSYHRERAREKETEMSRSSKLRECLHHAVDEGLMVPGKIVRAAIFARLESSYQIGREEIPEKLEPFHKALHSELTQLYPTRNVVTRVFQTVETTSVLFP